MWNSSNYEMKEMRHTHKKKRIERKMSTWRTFTVEYRKRIEE